MKLPDLFRTLKEKIRLWVQKFSKGTVSEHSSWVEVQKAILPYVEESITLLDIVSHKFKQLREEVVNTDD